jgi:hypothetical protein
MQKFVREFLSLLCLLSVAGYLSGCPSSKIKGSSQQKPAVKNPTFRLNSLSSATSQTPGSGELFIGGASPMNVTCSNCGSLNLAFSRTSENAAGFQNAYVAKFSHPFVTQTFVCKAKLRVDFPSEQTIKEFVYGIYFCPEDPQSHSRNCNKSGAVERCGF